MKHQTRLIIIGVLTALVIVGEVVLMALGRFGDTESLVLGGLLSVLLPALVDAAAVERRRRNPDLPALPDDVREDGSRKPSEPAERPATRRPTRVP